MTNKKILWFTRGISFGHATRDIAIIRQIQSIDPSIEIVPVSYDNGYTALENHGFSVRRSAFDYSWLDSLTPPQLGEWFQNSVESARQFIAEHKPDLVVSDEEYLISLACAEFGVPSILISDKFPGERPPPHSTFMRLGWEKYKRIIVPDVAPDKEPPGNDEFVEKIEWVGKVVRSPTLSKAREEIRDTIGVEPDETYIMVTNGANSRTADIFRLADEAMKCNANPKWIWGYYGPYAPLPQAPHKYFNTCSDDYLEHLYASDVVVTGAGLSTLNEILNLRTPCVVLPGMKFYWQVRDAKRITAKVGFVEDWNKLNGTTLNEHIAVQLNRGIKPVWPEQNIQQPALRAARIIVNEIS